LSKKPRQNDAKIVEALANGINITQAARSAGVSARTVSRRLKDPAFRASVTELQDATLHRVAGKVAGAAENAVTTLNGLLSARNETVRLGAAKAVLELNSNLLENRELKRHVRDLEAGIERQNSPEVPPLVLVEVSTREELQEFHRVCDLKAIDGTSKVVSIDDEPPDEPESND
jgi:hypothetical protein